MVARLAKKRENRFFYAVLWAQLSHVSTSMEARQRSLGKWFGWHSSVAGRICRVRRVKELDSVAEHPALCALFCPRRHRRKPRPERLQGVQPSGMRLFAQYGKSAYPLILRLSPVRTYVVHEGLMQANGTLEGSALWKKRRSAQMKRQWRAIRCKAHS